MKDNLTSISKNLTEKVEFTTAFNEEVLYEEMGVYRNPDGSYDIEVAYLDYDLSGNLQAVDTVYYFYEWDDENNQIITFTHEQTVSSEFYEWFMRNAEPLLKFRLEIRERNRVVDTLDFYACPGMTWLEFVQSDFNIDGYFYMIRLVDEYSVQTSEHLSSSIREDDGAGVSGGALVKNDHVYYQEIGSSSGGAG